MPRASVRHALPDLVPRLRKHLAEAGIPRDKSHVGEGHPVAHQPLGPVTLGAQNALDDAQDAPDLGGIAVDGGLDLLRVEVHEPGGLAEVGALAARLEVQPLVAEVALPQRAVRDAAGVGVVLLGQVLVDGARLPQRHARVRVLDRRHPAVGVDVGEWLLLDVVEAERLDLVVEAEFLQEEDGLWEVSAGRRPDTSTAYSALTFHGFGPGAGEEEVSTVLSLLRLELNEAPTGDPHANGLRRIRRFHCCVVVGASASERRY